jgi:hypothetical protein
LCADNGSREHHYDEHSPLHNLVRLTLA